MDEIDALLRLTHPTLDFFGVFGVSIASLPTDADFVDFASNYFKSLIALSTSLF